MNRKPLPELLKQVDQILGIEKSAQAVQSDEVFALADVLASAEGLEKTAGSQETAVTPEFEKIAIALNRVVAAKQIMEFSKLAAFSKRAREEGYSDEQIDEALQKIASSHLKKNLGFLGAISAAGMGSSDENSLEKRPVKASSLGEASRRLPLARSAGGSR